MSIHVSSPAAAKRGPKPYQAGSRRLMPIDLIARELGVSRRSVYYTLDQAIAKLQLATALYLGRTEGVRQ